MSTLYCKYCMNELEIDSAGLCAFCGMNPGVSVAGPVNITGMAGESIIKYTPSYSSASYGGQSKGTYGKTSVNGISPEEIDSLIRFGNNFFSGVIFLVLSLGIFWFKIPFLVTMFLKILAIFGLPVPPFLVT